jgi:hypothetical protein
MAISRVSSQDKGGSSSASSVSVTYPGSTTPGDLLIAAGIQNNAGTLAISGWNVLVTGFENNVSVPTALFYRLADGTESTITLTGGGTGTTMSLDIFEYTGNANPIATDGTAAATNSGGVGVTSQVTPNITTTNANDLIFYCAITQTVTSATWNSGATVIGTNTGGTFKVFCGQQIVSSPQTNFNDTITYGASHVCGTLIAGFQAVSSGAPQEFLAYNSVGR